VTATLLSLESVYVSYLFINFPVADRMFNRSQRLDRKLFLHYGVKKYSISLLLQIKDSKLEQRDGFQLQYS
jgi:hypothetical protein